MTQKLLLWLGIALLLLIPAGTLSAQGPTRTPTSNGLGSFLGGAQTAATPTSAKTDPVTQALVQENYTVISSGTWYDVTGKPTTTVVHVFMLAASADPKNTTGVKQIASGFAALRSQYPTATTYHVLLLSGPNIYDASTTSNALQLLSTNLVTPDAFIKDVLNGMKTISLVGAFSNAAATATATTAKATTVPTRVPTRKPTTATSSCNAPADKARLWVKNGYSGTMRFTVGGGEWGTHDFDIPSDAQYHFIDMPPSDKYTYSASIPGVGKASEKLPAYFAGQCYYLTFTP